MHGEKNAFSDGEIVISNSICPFIRSKRRYPTCLLADPSVHLVEVGVEFEYVLRLLEAPAVGVRLQRQLRPAADQVVHRGADLRGVGVAEQGRMR